MIALTDCSPIVIAHEKGMFRKYGINSTVSKGANWAAIRDSLSNGDIQATHMLLGMPIASTMGLLGSPKKPMIIPWILNRNGQSITLKADLKGKVAADPKALKPLVEEAKKAGEPMSFAMTSPPGTHAMWMRYYLGAGGINPDKDVALITIPPPQMVANMNVGKMDGYCVGEPWNARAVIEGIGFTSVNTQDIWKDHPEKVCAFTAEFADQNPRTVKAVLKALHEASVWLDKLENRPEQVEIVSKATYINCPQRKILISILLLIHLIVPAHRAQRVPLVPQVLQVLPARQDHKAPLEAMARTARQVPMVPQARRVSKASLEPMVRMVPPVRRVPRV